LSIASYKALEGYLFYINCDNLFALLFYSNMLFFRSGLRVRWASGLMSCGISSCSQNNTHSGLSFFSRHPTSS